MSRQRYRGLQEQEYEKIIIYLDESHLKKLPSFKPLDFLPEKDLLRVVAAYNDLVLCRLHREDERVYYICNPFTKQYAALPPLGQPSDSEYFEGAVLYACGDEDDKFKVMIATHNPETEVTLVEVFSSEDNAWRRMDTARHEKWINMLPGFVWHQCGFYDGMVVWLVDDLTNIIGIKIDEEHGECCTRIIPLPPDNPNLIMGVFRGHLRLTAKEVYETSSASLKLKMWELDEQSGAWKLVHDLGLSDMKDSEDRSKLESCLPALKTQVLSFDGNVINLCCRHEDEDGDETESIVVLFSCDLWNRTLKTVPSPLFPSVLDGTYHLSMPCWPSRVPLLPTP